MPKSNKTLAQHIADLEDPTPRDFDPEAEENTHEHADGSDSEQSTDKENGREHYETVGKSKLRQPADPSLGPAYNGTKISRNGLFDMERAGSIDSESSDDPFARGSGGEEEESDTMEGDEDDFVDPDTVDLNAQAEDDEEIDSDEAFGEGEEEDFKHYVFRASKSKRRIPNEHDVGKSDGSTTESNSERVRYGKNSSKKDPSSSPIQSSSEPDLTDNESSEDSENSDDASASDASSLQDTADMQRKSLKAMLANEQKSMVATISQAANEDALKGAAVRKQQSAYDSLLNTRVRLQKAIVASNSTVHPETPKFDASSDLSVIEAAESAALQLFNSLSALRASLPSSSTTSNKEQPFTATMATSKSDILNSLRALDKSSSSRTRATISKWAEKTHTVATTPSQSKFSNAPVHSLTSVLDTQLSGSNMSRLLSRTRTPRNSAPLHSASGIEEDSNIYDDADWYSLLLRDLVDSKMNSASSIANNAALATSTINGPSAQSISALQRENKQHRKGVDVKASKGRKMRYTVHEKLQNFMAPEDKGMWEQAQADELFAGLLGRKVKGGLGETLGDDSEDEGKEVEGFKLFGNNMQSN